MLSKLINTLIQAHLTDHFGSWLTTMGVTIPVHCDNIMERGGVGEEQEERRRQF